ncbi:MAG TPA: tetratricopeptide repeat protein [Vicinamibacteria bacterium]|nr:tetratricopeptide repeat protein [Vicinamibacteria bacterium]
MPRRRSPALWSFLALVTAADVRGESRDTARGLVVEEVARASASERGGIRPGDFIVAWTRGGAEGAFASPFDLLEVEVEQLPRGPITLAGRRGDGAMAWTLPPAPYGLAVRPALDTDALAAYEEGARLVESKKFSEGAARWSAAAEAAQQPLVGAWLLSRAAKALAGARIWAEADAAYERAVGRADESGSPTATAHLLRQWADSLRGRSDWAPAEDRYRRALALDQKRPAESLAVALTLNNLGILEMFRGDLDRAERYLREALAIRERLAPGSLVVAATVNNLGA